jgi:arsenate reductase-like glutaredoxin family protein
VRGLVRKLGAEVEERDYSKSPLTRAEVSAIVDAAGSVAAVLNTRHAAAKEHGWKERPPAKATFVTAVLDDPNLLRRPILVDGKTVVIGKDEAALKKALR